MANTYVDYTATAAQQYFAFNFPYLEDDHVIVEIEGVDQTITTNYTIETSPSQRINLSNPTTALAGGELVRIKRRSAPNTNLVDFQNGSVLTEAELDRAYLHNRYLAEEATEGADSGLKELEGSTNYNAGNKQIKNLADGTLATDAVNKGYVDTQIALTDTNLAGFYKSTHTGNGTDNVFTLSFTPQTTDAKAYIVSIDGLVQVPDTDYTIGATAITFNTIPANSAEICVVATAAASVATVNEAQVTATGSTRARSLADRFADVVNVLDYGADNTGATDNTTIIQSLINAAQNGTGGRSIYFPAGEYYFEPQSGKINTCLQFAESDPTYQDQPEPIKIYGDGSNSRIVVNNVGANNVWMAGPDGASSECVSAVFVEDLNFCSSSAAASDATDRTTYKNNYITMPNYARIFNVGRMWRCEFRNLFFEYCNGFFTENSGEDSNNYFAQQITVDGCYSTQHQYYFIDLNQAWACTFSNNTMESGNGCMKIGRSSGQSSYGVRIIGNTMQGNGTDYCGLRLNFGSSIYICGNYFESNRGGPGTATPQIFFNNNAPVVTGVTISDGGSSYESAPTVTFTGGGGSGAAGYAVLDGSQVDSVVMTDNGSGYSSPPAVSFTGGGGSDAAGTSILSNTESSIVIDGNFFAQSLANINGYGGDYYHVRLDEVRDTVVFRGNTFTGGNAYNCISTSDGYLISLNDKFEPVGSTYNEGIVATGITFSDTIPIYKPATVWIPVISDAQSGGNQATIGTLNGLRYVRNGDLVTISAQMLNIDTTGMTAGNTLYIQGLPFTASSEGLSQGSCVLDNVTFSGFIVPQIGDSSDVIQLRQSSSGGGDLSLTVGALNSGSADIQFTITYKI